MLNEQPQLLRYHLTDSTTLLIQWGSITTFTGDAVICAGNKRMEGPPSHVFQLVQRNMAQAAWFPFGSGSGSIFEAAGPSLSAACLQVPEVEPGVRCPTGEARLTHAGKLAARHVIHTVGPVYTFPAESAPLLESAYRSCLMLANEHKLKSIAFPAISCGGSDFPTGEAAEIALRVCAECAGGLEEVHFFLWGRKELVSWVAQARASFQELPPPAVQPAALDELMRAAQQGRRQAVLDLLQAWSLQPGGGGRLAPAGSQQQPGSEGDADADAEEEGEPSPTSSSPRDRGASSSLGIGTPTQQQPGLAGLSAAADQPPSAPPQQQPARVELGGRSHSVDVGRWTFNYSDLKKLKRLGAGSFGAVWMVSHHGTTFALKELLGARQAEDGQGGPALTAPELHAWRKEAELLAGLRHPHVLAFMGIVVSPPCIVTELCTQGSLCDLLRAAAGGKAEAQRQLTWVRRLALLWGVAKGMHALHSHEPPIIHRDLRSPNVLVDRGGVAKVADFGLSRFADDSAGARSKPSLADFRNPRWLAPEVLHSIMHSDMHPASKASDVYSFGCVMYECLTWRHPFGGVNEFLVAHRLQAGERPAVPAREALPGSDTPRFAASGRLDAFQELMRHCWADEPESRPCFADIATSLRDLLHAEQQAGSAAAPAAAATAER